MRLGVECGVFAPSIARFRSSDLKLIMKKRSMCHVGGQRGKTKAEAQSEHFVEKICALHVGGSELLHARCLWGLHYGFVA